VYGDAPQTVVGRPQQPGLLADEGGKFRGVGDHVQEGLGAEVGADRVDGKTERGGQLVVVGSPFGSGDDARDPDPVPGELGGRDHAGRSELVRRPGEQLVGLVEDPGGCDAVGELPCGPGDGPEGGVDGAGPDGGDRRDGVEQGHDIKLGLGMRAVEVAQQSRRSDPAADHVDPQRAATGPYRGGGPVFGLEQIAGVRQERLPVHGELGAARRTGEQPHAEVFLQRGDALGDSLLSNRQVGCGVGKLPGVRDGDEGAHGIEIHATRP
jgi:hypothetical protein